MDGMTARLDVAEALDQLPENDRAILVLRYQEGLDYAAIGEVTGLAEGTVSSRLNRARNRLRQLLKQGYGGDGRNRPGSASNK